MNVWMLTLCLLGTGFALPMYPQHTGTRGMASMSLEMRQYGRQNMNMLPQYGRYDYGEPFNSVWLHGLLPPHSSFPWLQQRPQEHETQQYEYAMPVHPPPLPSLQTPLQPQQPRLQAQNPSLRSTLPTKQGQIQLNEALLPVQVGQPPLQQGELPGIQQQLIPADKQLQLPALEYSGHLGQVMYPIVHQLVHQGPMQPQQQPALHPALFYMSYAANQGGAPARLGIVSSEEMLGGRGGVPAYGAMIPGFRGMPQDPALQGDFTTEDDNPATAHNPAIQGGANQGFSRGSRFPAVNRAGHGSAILLPDGTPAGHEGFLPNINDMPGQGVNPVGQRGTPEVTPTATAPELTQGIPDSFMTFGAEGTVPLGIQKEVTADPTMFPEAQHTLMAGNGAEQPQVMQDVWHFQEP
uniref:Ameloblastin n=1 Tax=Caiman crocodilus TaxID=8499 RepID=Q8JIW6_CAICR|nr:ameloblastin [Caiman crocodilus]